MNERNLKKQKNPNGPTLVSVSCPYIEKDGLFFKDLSRSGSLLPYEDWRLDAVTRARDLSKRLSIEEIAGLMMYSPHQMVPFTGNGPFRATYDGKEFELSGKKAWDMTDQQKDFLQNAHIRHVLTMYLQDTSTAVKWNNEMQAFAENEPWGIPINFSSDPRHGAEKNGAEYKSSTGEISKWPENMGIAACFDTDICRQFAEAVAKEYRALGITTALSPQIDVATEPRWMRFEDTFGMDPNMVTELGRAYCDALQTTQESKDGWGMDSVNAMAKHWPGGGPCEGGRDAHYAFGKYAVYPGENDSAHRKPFLEGAFQLDGATKKVSAIMPYYTVSWGLDKKEHKNVGNSYSHYVIHDLLREKYGFDGVVCTDWGITDDPASEIDSFGSRCYGVEELSVAERHLLAIMNGVDQFGGNSDPKPILEAYEIGCKRYGEAWMHERMEQSAVRLLTNIFRTGLFENPYLDEEESVKVVGREDFCKAGYEAQRKSLVMIKNKNRTLPTKRGLKVYIPERTIKARKNFFRGTDEEKKITPVKRETVAEFFHYVEKPEDADLAVIFIESPLSDGYDAKDLEKGGNGYIPISLQYRPYQAKYAREVSIAGGDFREKDTNRSYKNKMGYAANEGDMDLVIETKKTMPDKPVIVVLRMHNPTVMSELEPYADAILVDFGVQRKVIFELLTGVFEPSGLLPLQLPADMRTVEEHFEDVPLDMKPYQDSEGNVYDFAYGLNWSGVITDDRTKKYARR